MVSILFECKPRQGTQNFLLVPPARNLVPKRSGNEINRLAQFYSSFLAGDGPFAKNNILSAEGCCRVVTCKEETPLKTVTELGILKPDVNERGFFSFVRSEISLSQV